MQSVDFDLTGEQRIIQDSTRRMVERDIQPILDAHDVDQPLPKSEMARILQACAAIGMIGGRVSAKKGGTELSMVDLGLMYEQMPANVFFGVLSQEVTAARIGADCTPEQEQRFLADVLSAHKIACTATTEPGDDEPWDDDEPYDDDLEEDGESGRRGVLGILLAVAAALVVGLLLIFRKR